MVASAVYRFAANLRSPLFLSGARGVYRLGRKAPKLWPMPFLARGISAALDPNNIRRHTAIRGRRYVTVCGLLGCRYRVNVNDHIGWRIYLNGSFDVAPIVTAAFLRTMRDGVFFDVGANIGSIAVPVAKLGIPTIAIEAAPTALSELSANARINSPIPLTMLNVAVSSAAHCREVRMIPMHSPQGNLGATSMFADWNRSKAESGIELSRLTTLDNIVDWLRPDGILAVKIDIEGAEVLALEGFQQTLERLGPPVVFEWRPDLTGDRESVDIRSLFPPAYAFYAIEARERGADFDLLLSPFDPSRPAENVLAAPKHLALDTRLGQPIPVSLEQRG